MPSFLSPYRDERYHLHDYKGRGCHSQSLEKGFNYRKSSLRNVINNTLKC